MSYSIERKLQQAADQWYKTPSKQKYKTQVVPLKFVLNLIAEFSSRSIVWGVFDFESRARETEGWESGEDFEDMSIEVPEKFKRYDRTKFEDTLIRMIKEHDYNNGITWDTVDDYLDEFCKY